MHICQFCQAIIADKYKLARHIKTAKKCLKLRHINVSPDYKCKDCGIKFVRKDAMIRHSYQCWMYWKRMVEKKEIEISEEYEWRIILLEENIQILENSISRLRQRPTTVNIDNRTINNNNNLLYVHTVTKDRLENQSSHLTLQHLNNGAEGYAQYAIEYPLKDSIHCSDHSRRKLTYRDDNGDIIVDYSGRKLTREFFESILDETVNKAGAKFFAIDGDENLTEIEKSRYKERLQKIVSDVRLAANGSKTTFTQDWVNELCSLVKI